MTSDSIYYVDGEYVPASAAVLSVSDLAVLRGYGVFDYFRTYGGLPIQMERNIARLRQSAQVIQLTLPWTDQEIAAIVLETIRRNNYPESSVRLIVTGGLTLDFITPQDQPKLIVYVEPVKPAPSTWYHDGIKVITVNEERYIPHSKSLAYIPAILAQRAARAAGAVEALYQDRNGFVREGTTTNVFAYLGAHRVVTPTIDILPGITRSRVLEVLSDLGYVVEERALPYDELLTAQEVIITSSNKEVVPVVVVDDHTYIEQPGQWAKDVMAGFKAYTTAQVAARDAVV